MPLSNYRLHSAVASSPEICNFQTSTSNRIRIIDSPFLFSTFLCSKAALCRQPKSLSFFFSIETINSSHHLDLSALLCLFLRFVPIPPSFVTSNVSFSVNCTGNKIWCFLSFACIIFFSRINWSRNVTCRLHRTHLKLL